MTYPCSWCDAEAQVFDLGPQRYDLCKDCYDEYKFVWTHSYKEIKEYYDNERNVKCIK